MTINGVIVETAMPVTIRGDVVEVGSEPHDMRKLIDYLWATRFSTRDNASIIATCNEFAREHRQRFALNHYSAGQAGNRR